MELGNIKKKFNPEIDGTYHVIAVSSWMDSVPWAVARGFHDNKGPHANLCMLCTACFSMYTD
jgi:hypothetical protein